MRSCRWLRGRDHAHDRATARYIWGSGSTSPEEGAELLWHIACDLGYPGHLAFFVDEATGGEYAWELDQDESRRHILEEAGTLPATMTVETLHQEPDPDRLPVHWHQVQDPPTSD